MMYGTVERSEQLSPSMIRITFGGDGLASFVPDDTTDQYVNALFLPDAATYTVPFDVDSVRALDVDQRPRGRRFTVRSWDDDARRLVIDFVAHGDVGFAGRWAQRAAVGDRLQMVGPSGGYRPDPDADWYLLVGDESALPAIAASLEALTADAQAVVVVVVDESANEIDLPVASGVDLRWVHRRTAAMPEEALLDAVASVDWAPGRVDVFVHGEAGEVRAVRKHLLAERGVERHTASISPYWRRDLSDEAWREVKRQWLAEQAADT